MRVNSINPTINYSRGCKPRCQKLQVDEPKTEVSFKGWKGGTKGGAIGLAAAIGLSVVAPVVGAALLPLWTVGGAIAGHANEEENKPRKEDDNNDD